MNWILNGICVLGCFFAIVGTLQLIHHDLFIRYGKGRIERTFTTTEDQSAAPGGTDYEISYKDPVNGSKYFQTWIGLQVSPNAKVGDEVDVQYKTNSPSQFSSSYRGGTEINVRNLFIVGISCLLVSIFIRLWLVGRLTQL